MKNRNMLLTAILSMVLVFSLIFSASIVGASATVPVADDHSIIHSTMDGSGFPPAMVLNTPGGNVTPMVAAGWNHIVGLRADGAVVATGYSDAGQCDVRGWADILQVAAGGWHTVGLKSDGTVVAVGWNIPGQCEVGGWTEIIQVAAGGMHTVGLKDDNTVVAVGAEGWDHGQCEVGNWTNITQVAGGLYHTVGVESDGTVVALSLIHISEPTRPY